jgi:hypothetical protein
MKGGGGADYAHFVAQNDAISSALKQVDGYVDNRDVEHLNLNPAQ